MNPVFTVLEPTPYGFKVQGEYSSYNEARDNVGAATNDRKNPQIPWQVVTGPAEYFHQLLGPEPAASDYSPYEFLLYWSNNRGWVPAQFLTRRQDGNVVVLLGDGSGEVRIIPLDRVSPRP